jgi:DNA-binding response OmpR family regulator/TolB-like protein
MRRRLLVVASDVRLRMALARWLAPAGYAVELAEGAKKAREVLAAGEVVAGILRVEPPDVAFLAVARELRETGSGLIAVVDEVDEIDRLRRLGFGADVYLAQPLKKRDVLDRVEAVMQPISRPWDISEAIETIDFNGMTIDMAGHSLVDAAGREVKLTRAELGVLAALVRRPGQVLSRDRLLDAVSGRRAGPFDRSIDNLIARLRRKIERNARRPRLIVTVQGVGYKFSSRREASDAPSRSPSVTPRCSILVLPFANLGGQELCHSVAAISTILTTELRHVVGAQVLCHYANSADSLEIGRELGVRYILRGSVRRCAGDIRVNAQMADAKTGVPVWADRFDGKLADMFAFESEVTARIARAVDLELVDLESRCSLDAADGLDVLDLVTRGYAYLYRLRSAENLAAARGFFERALRLDDRRAEALAGLAHTHISDTLCRWSTDPDGQVRLADASVTRAIETNPKLAFAYHVRGLVLRVRQQNERAIAAFDMAVQLNPSLAPAHAEIGFVKHVLGRGESAFAQAHDGLALARRISPRDSVLANWLYGIGIIHLKGGENTEAIKWLNESIGLNPLPPALAYLAAAYALNGDDARARNALREFRRKRPHETLSSFGRRLLADHQILAGSRVFEGLRKAGLREK